MTDRADDARVRAQLAASTAAGESRRAQALIDEFVATARERGIEPVALQAAAPSGARVKTSLAGWYLKRNQSVAITVDGGYVVLGLMSEPSLLERVRGTRIAPQPPPLVVGRGGRDGESGDLADFLRARLEWPAG